MNKIEIQLALLLLVFIGLGCQSNKGTKSETASETNAYYTEQHRPQFHFTPEANWMNDPNGMVYFEGEYHLFYQYYPDSTVWGPMHWGHAISTDLIHWEHLPIALFPDSAGCIFSGSAVVDHNNTSGLGTDGLAPMIAIFTYHDFVGEKAGTTTFQNQGIAYSTDKGRTWKKYGEPVLKNPGIKDFRDPKVMWHSDTEKWIMTLAVQDHIEFYSSPNLIDWKRESGFGKELGAHGGVWECPDLIQMNVEGSDQKEWVLLVSINPGGPNGGSATQYFVGDFDGQKFTTSQKAIKWIDYGADNYAGVTWSNVPEKDGRTLFMGWMSNWWYAQVVPTEKWRSAMTFPRELVLSAGKIIKSVPVKELELLRNRNTSITNKHITDNFNLTQEVPFDLSLSELNMTLIPEENTSSIKLILSNSLDEKIEIELNLRKNELSVDRTKSGKTDFSERFYAKHVAPIVIEEKIKLQVLLDVASIEIFYNDGECVMTDIFFPTQPFNQIELVSTGAGLTIENASVYQLNSIW
ncbi:MAG: glycoside hydrolase family 32 protein [Prolixibacteraceae bacterium]